MKAAVKLKAGCQANASPDRAAPAQASCSTSLGPAPHDMQSYLLSWVTSRSKQEREDEGLGSYKAERDAKSCGMAQVEQERIWLDARKNFPT